MNPVGIHEPLDTASDYKLSENGSSREIDTQGAWLAIMQSCSAAQCWLPFNHLGNILENTRAWSHTEPMKSEALQVILMSLRSEKAQCDVDYKSLCNYTDFLVVQW